MEFKHQKGQILAFSILHFTFAFFSASEKNDFCWKPLKLSTALLLGRKLCLLGWDVSLLIGPKITFSRMGCSSHLESWLKTYLEALGLRTAPSGLGPRGRILLTQLHSAAGFVSYSCDMKRPHETHLCNFPVGLYVTLLMISKYNFCRTQEGPAFMRLSSFRPYVRPSVRTSVHLHFSREGD